MSKLTDQIREYISSPQVDGNEHYGKWGALRKDQRLLIADLCEYCDLQEKYADTFFKETQALKHQLAEKDEEIKLLKCEMIEYQVENEQLKMLGCEAFIRHQVCEEIRKKLKQIELSIENSPMFIDEEYKLNLKRKAVHKNVYKLLDQIEQGESK